MVGCHVNNLRNFEGNDHYYGIVLKQANQAGTAGAGGAGSSGGTLALRTSLSPQTAKLGYYVLLVWQCSIISASSMAQVYVV